MIRRIEQTVRFPVARMAPTARNWALTQVRLENSGAKAAKEATISGGRSTAVVSRGDGSSTTVDLGQRPPGSASQLGQSRGSDICPHFKGPSSYHRLGRWWLICAFWLLATIIQFLWV